MLRNFDTKCRKADLVALVINVLVEKNIRAAKVESEARVPLAHVEKAAVPVAVSVSVEHGNVAARRPIMTYQSILSTEYLK